MREWCAFLTEGFWFFFPSDVGFLSGDDGVSRGSLKGSVPLGMSDLSAEPHPGWGDGRVGEESSCGLEFLEGLW